MSFREYGNYDAIGLAGLVRSRQVSARELLDEAVARTARIDPDINAVVVKHCDYAERQIDNGLPDGPFTGVPFLLKDLVFLEGTRTTSGARVYKDNVEDHTTTLAHASLMPGSRSSERAPARNSDCCRPPSRTCSVRPEIRGISRTPPAVRPAAQLLRSPRGLFPSPMPATAAARYAFQPLHAACLD
jgi:hypothetical protein